MFQGAIAAMLHTFFRESQQFRGLLVWMHGQFIIEAGNFPFTTTNVSLVGLPKPEPASRSCS